MATVIVLVPAINYESFEYSDVNPLEQIRVFPAFTDEERLAALRVVAREVVEPDNVLEDGRTPQEPTVKLSEMGTDRVVKMQKAYLKKVAEAEARTERNKLVEAFFEEKDDSVADEALLMHWLKEHQIQASAADERPRVYFRELEAIL